MIGAALQLAPAAARAVKLPPTDALVEASRRGDEVELERAARRFGAARLLAIAAASTTPLATRRAALAALPLLDDGWTQLVALATLAAEPRVGAAAATAARRVAERLTPELAYGAEVPPDVPHEAQSALASLAARRELDGAVRAEALRAAAALVESRQAPPLALANLTALLADPERAVRRAAVDAVGARAATSPDALAALWRATDDGDGEVAIAALAAACPAGSAAELDERRRARVRALAAEARLPVAERRRLLPCLRRLDGKADRALARRLAAAKR